MRTSLALCLFAATAASPVHAAFYDTLGAATSSSDTTAFPNRYEGDALPTDPSYASLGFAPNGLNNVPAAGTASIVGGALRIDTDTNETAGDVFGYTLTGGAGTKWNPDFRGGWTVEFRALIRPSNSGSFGAVVQTADENSTGLTQLFFNKIIGDDSTTVSGLTNNDAFHTYRIASYSIGGDGGQQKYLLWRDGEQIATFDDTVSFPPAPFLSFGDVLSGSAEVNIDLDYLRWTDTAALPPEVPEPTSLALVGLAAVAGLRRRRA